MHALLQLSWAALVAGAACLTSPSAARAQFATPEVAIQALYALYRSTNGPGFPSRQAEVKRYLEPGLANAWIKDTAKASDGKNVINADPFIDAQDFKISDLVIEPSQITGDRATVQAHFRNFNERRHLVYRLQRGSDGWRIYDVASGGAQGLRSTLGLRD
jgi:hypothetical protein